MFLREEIKDTPASGLALAQKKANIYENFTYCKEDTLENHLKVSNIEGGHVNNVQTNNGEAVGEQSHLRLK